MKDLQEKVKYKGIEQTVADAIMGEIEGYETAKGYFANRPKEYPDFHAICLEELRFRVGKIVELLS